MTLSLEQIAQYSKCPRQLYYLEQDKVSLLPSFNKDKYLIKELIKQAYINEAQHGYTPQWETIKQRVNEACFAAIDINKREEMNQALARSISLLKVLHNWYFKFFLTDKKEALVNIPVSQGVNKSIVSGIIDLVFISNKEKVIPVFFNDDDVDPSLLYNSIKHKGLIWLLSKELDFPIKCFEFFKINPETIDIQKYFTSLNSLDSIEKYINTIVKGIESKVFYPSVSSQCIECPYNKICSI